jgi:DNA-binding transcriptional ArsR family regulator
VAKKLEIQERDAVHWHDACLTYSQIFSKRPLPEGVETSIRSSHYGLTRICRSEYIRRVECAFAIIAEPNRRAILSLLASSEQSVGEIERQLGMPQPSVSKHLRVLREAGFVESRVDAQRRLYRLRPEPLMEVYAWLAPFRRIWAAHLDALERHLDRMDQMPRAKGKKR